MPTMMCIPGEGLALTATGRARQDATAESAVVVRLSKMWEGRWWDPNLRRATEAEKVRVVSVKEEPRVRARAEYLLADLVTRNVITDVTITVTANFTLRGYDLRADYYDLVAGKPGNAHVFAPLI